MDKEKELNNILDECLDRLLFEDGTIEQCLKEYPSYAEELKPLLEASLVTSRISSLEPDPGFKAKARNEMFGVLSEAEEKRSRSFFRFSWQPRWASAVAVVVALLLATGGTAAASTGSMPDDFLYPVKRATEQVQLAFTFTNLGKAEAYARMADRRVEEIIYLANNNDTEEIELLASSLDSSLNNIAVYSLKSVTAGKTTESEGMMLSQKAVTTEEAMVTEDAAVTAVTGEAVLSSEMPDTDEEAAQEEQVTPAPTVVEPTGSAREAEVDKDESYEANVEIPPAIIVEPASADQSLSKKAALNISVINQANTNIRRLYELLDIVPESVRAVIEKAIRISEQGYGIAIDSLK